jgi:hypothetical protein
MDNGIIQAVVYENMAAPAVTFGFIVRVMADCAAAWADEGGRRRARKFSHVLGGEKNCAGVILSASMSAN